jgi:site-specific recombinase XerD
VPTSARFRKTAKRPALLFHDLRRSAVRNLVDAGVDQRVAMAITGHRTISVFQRYRIVNDDDVRAALEKTEVGGIHREDGNDATRRERSQ